MKILVTGCAAFIGFAIVRHIIRHADGTVINLDNSSERAMWSLWPSAVKARHLRQYFRTRNRSELPNGDTGAGGRAQDYGVVQAVSRRVMA